MCNAMHRVGIEPKYFAFQAITPPTPHDVMGIVMAWNAYLELPMLICQCAFLSGRSMQTQL